MNDNDLQWIRLGLYTLIQLWANKTNKPPGWNPSAEELRELFQDLRADVVNSSHDALLAQALARRNAAAGGATTATS
jgi:hypothetical protein